MTTPDDLSLFYDELHRWTVKDQNFQTFSGYDNDSIHRFLIDPVSGAFSPDTVYAHLDPYMPAFGTARGLDAGCGYGGACFRNLRVHGGRWTGVTISPRQLARANAIAQARGVAHAVDFHLQSYDQPLPARYNVIVAIESLIHSSDPSATLRNLSRALDDGGHLIIVDDMPADELATDDAGLLAAFRAAWRCPHAPTAAAWTGVARTCDLRLVARSDLSDGLRPRAEDDLDAAWADVSAQRAVKVREGFTRLSDAELGGLLLERLHRRGAMRYMLLTFARR